MEQMFKAFKGNIRQYGMIIALAALSLFFYFSTSGRFIFPMNISNLITQNSYVLILAIGMLLVILTGNVDLSVGSVVAVVGAVAGVCMYNNNWPVFPTIIVCIIAGMVIGLWQGFWIAIVKLPPFIATLAGMLIFRGLTLVILQGKTLAPLPRSYSQISSGFVPDFIGNLLGKIGITVALNATAMLVAVLLCILILVSEFSSRRQKQRYGFEVSPIPAILLKVLIISVAILFIFWRLSLYRGIPWVLVIIAVLALTYTFVLNRTTIGRHIYAYGGNAKAAELSGIKTRNVLYGVFINMSVLAAVAGMVFSGRMNSSSPLAGQSFELDAIAACFLGGASASGGVGTIVGALTGAFIMGILNNGMSIMGVSIDVQQVVKGLVVLIAVSFDIISKSKSSK